MADEKQFESTEDIMHYFADNLKTLRQSAGLTQQDLADMVGVTRQTINNVETQKTPLSKTLYIAISGVFDSLVKQRPVLEASLAIFNKKTAGMVGLGVIGSFLALALFNKLKKK